MPSFEEKPGKEFGNVRTPESDSRRHDYTPQEFEPESSESRIKRETLAHLIESGRAKTTEEADHYLASLNRLKEQLLLFAREFTVKQIRDPNSFSEDGMIFYASRRARESDLKKIAAQNMDRADPNVWYLDREVSSSYPFGHSSSAKRLTVKTRLGSVEIDFDPHGNTANKLKQQLSKEEVELLRREYAFAHRDLARQLRLQADMANDQEIPKSPKDERALGALFEEEETV
jgi:hypothetical protein